MPIRFFTTDVTVLKMDEVLEELLLDELDELPLSELLSLLSTFCAEIVGVLPNIQAKIKINFKLSFFIVN